VEDSNIKSKPLSTKIDGRFFINKFLQVITLLSDAKIKNSTGREVSSRWFGLSLPIICVLLLYAAIQPLFIAFAQWPKMTIAVLIAALGLKISFFMVLRYSLRHGLVLNYPVCLPLLKKRVNSIIENQTASFLYIVYRIKPISKKA
jgi:riboflavin transporter FmnP